jgi:hypothetical protein
VIEIRPILLANPGVFALVGERIYPENLQQASAMPAITYSTLAGADAVTHDGSFGLADLSINIDCWGSTYLQKDALFRAVMSALVGYSSGDVQGIFLIRRQDLYDDEPTLFRRSVGFSVWLKEL